MNKDQYLRMVEQTGEEIDWEKCPPDSEDFPDSVITALNIYHQLGNRMAPDIGFIGKDYANLELLFTLYGINAPQERDWAFDLLYYLDGHYITESQQKIKAEYNKMKK